MADVVPVSDIYEVVSRTSVGPSADSFFLASARVLGNIYLSYRRMRLSNENPISFAAGSALSGAFGSNPTVQQISRFVLGTLSIIRCTEDLHKINKLREKCSRIFSGKQYLVVKGDRFNIKGEKASRLPQFMDQFHYEHKMRLERIAAYFRTIGKIIEVFCKLMLHIGDAYIAYNEDCVSEVFIHGRDLWDKLTSDNAYLYRQLEKSDAVNQLVLNKVQGGWALNVMKEVVVAAGKLHHTFSNAGNALIKAADKGVQFLKSTADEIDTAFKEHIQGIPPELQFDNKPYRFVPGSDRDPEKTRFITVKKVRITKQAKEVHACPCPHAIPLKLPKDLPGVI